MNIPKKIKVGPYDYTISVEDEDWLHSHDTYGQCYDIKRRISIVVLDNPCVVETLLHEILHACYAVMDLKEKEGEETTVTRLATALTMVFRDNPDLVDLIKELNESQPIE